MVELGLVAVLLAGAPGLLSGTVRLVEVVDLAVGVVVFDDGAVLDRGVLDEEGFADPGADLPGVGLPVAGVFFFASNVLLVSIFLVVAFPGAVLAADAFLSSLHFSSVVSLV